MVWLWLLFPLLLLALTLALWRATTALGRERARLQSEVDTLSRLTGQARAVGGAVGRDGAIGREPADR